MIWWDVKHLWCLWIFHFWWLWENYGISPGEARFFGPLSNRSVTVTPSHRPEVKAVCWTSDDFRLVSTGQDGATYEYDILKEGRRVSDAWLMHQWSSFRLFHGKTDPWPFADLWLRCEGKLLDHFDPDVWKNFLAPKRIHFQRPASHWGVVTEGNQLYQQLGYNVVRPINNHAYQSQK